MSVLLIDIAPGDSVEINGNAKITLEEKTGRRARIRIEADKSVQVKRLSGKQDGHNARTTESSRGLNLGGSKWQEQ